MGVGEEGGQEVAGAPAGLCTVGRKSIRRQKYPGWRPARAGSSCPPSGLTDRGQSASSSDRGRAHSDTPAVRRVA